MHLAATPAWLADNIALIAILTLAVAMILVLRLVEEVALRTMLVALIAAIAILVYVNRTPLEVCARTCECQIAGRDITVPLCDPDVNL